ncbi:hypothetical protein MALH04_00191 [Mycoplasma anatis]|uniref:hypothetical protein n=1 Tax=Mycoplasmopsis anatis TaxID=171279 RepID=UPI001C4DEFA0|nr:hypothetical protein [Mycoplasmopsis anatis]MBW0594440.1 hypothetical protein [Mycoplasmopsis anatis]MBW0598589.1 hypothetical protein [Mycoplasmopsis anatis]MBW0598846.1 hypothetical protein [Mycoplasmopsis anatis]MBW0601069.1 hypothetical protein [Mycoplasmopsis anatis]
MIKIINDKKKILMKNLFRINFPWFIAISVLVAISLIMILSTIPWIINHKNNIRWNIYNNSYGRYSIWVISIFKNGVFSFSNYSFSSNSFLTILIVVFFIISEYKINSIYFKKHTMQLIKEKNIKYIPLISSISLCLYTFFTFIIVDLVVFAILKDVRNQLINGANFTFENFNINFWKSEFIVIAEQAIHYIFLVGLIYSIIDLYRYKISNTTWVKISLLILIFSVVIPFVLIMLWRIIFNVYPNQIPLKIIQWIVILLNPFDSSFIGAYPLFSEEFLLASEETQKLIIANIENIKWIIKGIYIAFAIIYVIFHFIFKNRKHE